MNGYHNDHPNNGRAFAHKLLPDEPARDGLSIPSLDGLPPHALTREELGAVVGGSLGKGLEVRLDADVPVEEMAVGRYVTVATGAQRFFGMITDIELQTTMPGLAQSPPGPADEFLREVYQGTAAFGMLHVSPMLRVSGAAGAAEVAPEPVKTVPPHFSRVREASQEEVEEIFGKEDLTHFVIGTPLDMEVKVRLSYERFVERSNGIFGKSGTGKTFLTRMLLLNIMQKSNGQREPKDRCVQLVFDMHNEYGWKGTSEDAAGGEVKGLKALMPNSVVVYTLDPESSQRRKSPTDGDLLLGKNQIEPEDIALLAKTINLSENAVDACYALEGKYRERWFEYALALSMSEDDGAEERDALSIHAATVRNLQRGLNRLVRDKPFIVPQAPFDTLDTIIGTLQHGKSVVIEFGRFGGNLDAYMLVANVLTRRIHERWRALTETSLGVGSEKPVRLMIAIEEAHKFLDPEVAGHTIFGEIAREMRKYNVTLLVIDQRPSAIDSEVMSQFGTRVTCLLDNERDIDAVLSGVSGKSGLRDVLARLDSKQQALIMGHAVPMPIVVRPEDYTSTYARFAQSLGVTPGNGAPAKPLSADDLYD